MNIDLNLYYIFHTVAKLGSITKASEELFVSQPAITQSIKTLESLIGATLFIRTKKGVILTEEAKVLYNYIDEGLTFIKNGEAKFQELMNLQDGTLKIGASTTVTQHVLLPYLEKFTNLYPNINVSITNHLTSELITLLRNGTVDILILNLPTEEYFDLEINPFMEVHDIFAVSNKLKKLLEKEHSLTDLLKNDFIFQKSPSNTRTFLNNFLSSKNMVIEPKYEVVSFNLVKDMTKIGLGIGYLTKEFIESEIKNKELFPIKIKPSIPPRQIGLVTIKKNIPSFAARSFINLILNKKKDIH
ncbi:MAG: LysR family transcriptional regulator [Bacilli bacterium]|nr:LysR family transcriptional regulator [Bacilli bacterium]